jgi:lipocalin
MFSKKQVSFALAALYSASASSWFGSTIVSAQEPPCKPVNTVDNFDLEGFVSAPWYTHQQAENNFAPPNQSCVRAEYTIRDEPSIPWGYTVDVYNSGRNEGGEFVDANLCVFQEDGSKLRVAPCFVPKVASGNFWVVAYDETEGYALISAGQPTRPGENGCRTGESMDDEGLWIFSRSPVRDEALVITVRQIAQDAGFDTTVLNDVDQQESCYDDEDTEPTCRDVETSFSVWFSGDKDCDWVDDFAWFRCLFHSDECPETCGKCE